jgi:hypothetical protein
VELVAHVARYATREENASHALQFTQWHVMELGLAEAPANGSFTLPNTIKNRLYTSLYKYDVSGRKIYGATLELESKIAYFTPTYPFVSRVDQNHANIQISWRKNG